MGKNLAQFLQGGYDNVRRVLKLNVARSKLLHLRKKEMQADIGDVQAL